MRQTQVSTRLHLEMDHQLPRVSATYMLQQLTGGKFCSITAPRCPRAKVVNFLGLMLAKTKLLARTNISTYIPAPPSAAGQDFHGKIF